MSQAVSGRGVRFISNSLLLLGSTWTAKKLTVEAYPYAFSACVVGGAAALVGILHVLLANEYDVDELRQYQELRKGMLELMPLPLVNMQLYMLSQGMGTLVMAHASFVLPLAMDICCSLAWRRKNCYISETLRDLCMLGNILSLGFLAFKERNSIYLRLMLTMASIKYGPMLFDGVEDEAGENLLVLGSAMFLYSLGKAQPWAGIK
ncbi:CG14537 [Drosophila busckii]|uniref:CG14537 n=1 Tax=Drosophila busckii TaxID=30019 RepID=A0A0M4EPW7_DROBS|nr:CG14537 [Drosophila busckii]ALC39467.1 CG14537 [Drosophila busckii]